MEDPFTIEIFYQGLVTLIAAYCLHHSASCDRGYKQTEAMLLQARVEADFAQNNDYFR